MYIVKGLELIKYYSTEKIAFFFYWIRVFLALSLIIDGAE